MRVLTEVVISEGQSVSAIADILTVKGVIGNRFAFVIYTIVSGNERKLQAGRYVFKPGVTIPTIIHSMSEGFAESDDMVIIIPEGFNVFDIDKRLADFRLIEEGEFARKYYIDEGQFFPDTYRLKEEGETVDAIAQRMKNHLNLKFKDTSLVLSVLVFNDTIIRASILEKEARREEDMRLVAGIIENRLERGMFLQIDATVAYGACLRRFKDLDSSQLGTEIISGTYYEPLNLGYYGFWE